MKNCKHPIKNLRTTSMYESSPDGYGGYNEWNWYELECTCKKTVKLNDKNSSFSSPCITEDNYYDLTGREINLKEAQAIFKQNKELYDDIDLPNIVHDAVLRTKGKRTDKLEKKIAQKRKLINKHKKELNSMLATYHGGTVPHYENY